MTNRDAFTPEEWTHLKDALLLSGLLVTFASPQGALGLARELGALGSALQEMLNRGSGLELIDALRSDLMRDAGLQQALKTHLEALTGDPQDAEFRLRSQTVSRCRQAAALLSAKAGDDEREYYRRGLLWAGLQVARASREEGGWRDRDVQPVTEAEGEALRQVAFAFGLPRDEAMVEQLPAAAPRQVPGEYRAAFTPDEWAVLRLAPVQAGAAVSTAAPSGLLGLARELAALGRSLQEARRNYAGNRLVAALIDDMALQASGNIAPLAAGEAPASAEEALAQAVQACRQVRDLLTGRVDENDGLELRRMIYGLARSVAESSREGGFMGIGGQAISEAETRALNLLAAALDLPEEG